MLAIDPNAAEAYIIIGDAYGNGVVSRHAANHLLVPHQRFGWPPTTTPRQKV